MLHRLATPKGPFGNVPASNKYCHQKETSVNRPEQPSTRLTRPVPWTQTVALMTAISIPLALNRWAIQGFVAAAAFLGVMAVTCIIAVLFGRRSRAALLLFGLAVAVVSISTWVVIVT